MKSNALGSDPNAAGLKEVLKKHLTELGYPLLLRYFAYRYTTDDVSE